MVTNDLQKFEERHQKTESQPIAAQNSFLTTIERLASRPDIDVQKIQQIMHMQEHILDRNAKQAYNAAMVRAQMKMPSVAKKKYNSQTQSYYADFDAITDIAKPIYTAEGFAISFHEGYATPEKPIPEKHIRMIADVMHEEGHTETKEADIPLDDSGIKGTVNKTGPHAKGSSFQYGRRYMTCMIFGISTGDDDDGNNAGGSPDKFITEAHAKEIAAMMEESSINKTVFLKSLHADSVENIPASAYKQAITVLNARLDRKA